MLIALEDGDRVEAARADRGSDFRCPRCRRAMVLKRGRIRIAHFAHKPPTDCGWARGETLAHLRAKAALRDALAGRGLDAQVEFEVSSLGAAGDRRADVLVRSPSGRPVAIELQHTPVPVADIEQRTESYLRAGVAVLWLPFIRDRLWASARCDRDQPEGAYVVDRYPAGHWEQWLHGFNDGHIWYWDSTDLVLWRGRLGPCLLEAGHRVWYDDEGEERHSGGYSFPSKRWRRLTLSGPRPPDRLRLTLARRRPRRAGRYRFPGGYRADFVAAG